MSSLLDGIIADNKNVFYDATSGFAVSGVYSPQGGSPVTIPIILDEPIEDFFEGNHTTEHGSRRGRVNAADVATIKRVGRDGVGDSVVISGKTWYVIKIEAIGSDTGSNDCAIVLSDKRIGVAYGR